MSKRRRQMSPRSETSVLHRLVRVRRILVALSKTASDVTQERLESVIEEIDDVLQSTFDSVARHSCGGELDHLLRVLDCFSDEDRQWFEARWWASTHLET